MSLLQRNIFLSVVIFCLVVSRAATTVAVAANTDIFGLFPKIRVDVFNELPRGATFTIHCKSRDDDLGTHVIQPGQKYEFSFRVNFFKTTLFHCGVSWEGGHVDFALYRASRDDNGRCDEYCRWQARGDAIVGYRENRPDPDIVIPWNK
ncbi:hypothetical protein CDL15_Pgr011019 [Punica granatum]|uniref:S-protein homolog n=1 Tax=Punica granatum TaxID=22663 RepID=A0A218XLR2_PUNGR|nr:hypothetical protein CDL15_Pgr011019 [Punica granatum]PKI36226.1 hypothetical protein CRG98_043378 [Punica granatum]